MNPSTSKRGASPSQNVPSSKKQRTENDGLFEIPQEILLKLTCSVCKRYLSCSPVMMDSSGHNVCGECSENLPRKLVYQRMQAYEDLAKAALFPCRYGCQAKFPFDIIKNHEETCKIRTHKCPVKRCSWEGTVDDIEKHFEKHPELLFKDGIAKFSLESIGSNEEKKVLIKAFDNLFLVKTKYISKGKKLLINVGMYEKDVDTTLYFFNTEVMNTDNKRSSCTWSDPCRKKYNKYYRVSRIRFT